MRELRLLQRLASDRPAAILPQHPLGPEGAPRRVGVEVEFTGLELEDAGEVVRRELQGELRRDSRYELRVETPSLGSFRLEVDDRRLKRFGRRRRRGRAPGLLEASAESLLALAVGTVTPFELVTPPLPVEELPRVDRLVAALGAAGAEGTSDPLRAYGVHFNPEVADPSARGLHAHLRAWAALGPWLRERLDVDPTRRLTPWIDPLPRDYVVRLLGETEPPADRAALVRSYLLASPTRNRALDMLPLFAHLEPELVEQHVHDPLLKPRPTFHFRLPDSRVGEAGWSLLEGWRTWLVVEDLALDRPRLDGLCAWRREALAQPFEPGAAEQAETIRSWLTRAL